MPAKHACKLPLSTGTLQRTGARGMQSRIRACTVFEKVWRKTITHLLDTRAQNSSEGHPLMLQPNIKASALSCKKLLGGKVNAARSI
mmetsp:Transcript_73099/g.123178  ORF Transcript_73099/g.123178 Transcript_73099/m.123178 type:complete len:87 (+) Transcript_73099:179-439(+)